MQARIATNVAYKFSLKQRHVQRADLRVKIFADGADLTSITELSKDRRIAGFTTNPTLIRKAGLTDYESFAKEFLMHVERSPVSFEVLADDPVEMVHQARTISRWGENVYVKVPVTNTKGVSTAPEVHTLSADGVKVNVTAIFTIAQVQTVAEALGEGAPSNLSVFAGRIADAGVDPCPIMKEAVEIADDLASCEVIWASPREVLNAVQADAVGCHIITMTPDLIGKLDLLGKDLDEFSLDTVAMFHDDARAAGLTV
jgi:transaldolase